MSNIARMPAQRHDLHAPVQEIKDVVYSRAGSISVTEAIGAIEIAKLELLQDQQDKIHG